MEIFTLWLWPLLALLLLPGLLVYLGLHVVERGVIFVDLALAQVAALGVAVAILMGIDPAHDPLTYLVAVMFTFIGAAIFALTRFRHVRVPQEAIIGIVYIVSAAASVIVLSKTAEGDETIKNLLVGNILLVSRSAVLKTLAIFVVISLFHLRFRRRFMQASFDLEEAIAAGVNPKPNFFSHHLRVRGDELRQIAGVYLVFSYLIVPAVCGPCSPPAPGPDWPSAGPWPCSRGYPGSCSPPSGKPWICPPDRPSYASSVSCSFWWASGPWQPGAKSDRRR
jgi:zinc/manganese transport system permease protein